MKKTLEKLETICAPHGVEVDARSSEYGDWNITFYAPPKMCWDVSQASVVVYHGSLRGAVGYIKKELASGFYDADEATLLATGQSEED